MLSPQTQRLLDLKCSNLRITTSDHKGIMQRAAQHQGFSGIRGPDAANAKAVGEYFKLFKERVGIVHAAALELIGAVDPSEDLEAIHAYVDEQVTAFRDEAHTKIQKVSAAQYSREEPDIATVHRRLKEDFDYRAALTAMQRKGFKPGAKAPEPAPATTLGMLKMIEGERGGFSGELTEDQFGVMKELEASGYITGSIGPETHDDFDFAVSEVRLTTNGRLLMEELSARPSAAPRPTSATGTDTPSANASLTTDAARMLAEVYSGQRIIEITCSWATDCRVDVPHTQDPIPPGTTKRAALRENLMAFPPEERLKVIEDMASRSEYAHVAKFQELRAKIETLKWKSPTASPSARNPMSMEVFISHSSQDEAFAEAVVKLLRAALNLAPSEIRCTSVAGYKLPFGAKTAERLKHEVSDSQVFIALLTPASLESSYVLFEMGARWGKDLFLGPLVGSGAKMADLGPLSGTNALRADNDGDLHQFLGDVAKELNRTLNNTSSYLKEIQAVISAAK